MAFLLYNLVLLVLSPLIVLYLLHRVLVSGKSRKSWRQQLGGVTLPEAVSSRPRIWIHAVSVGESVASAAVVSEVKKSLPGVAVVVSTTTQTGQEMACKSVKDADAFLYFPFDLLPCVARSLSGVKPVVFASTDTEIWPNFLHTARRRGVKTAMINGTVSDRTMRGAARFPWIYRWMMSNVDRFCMQSEADAQRATELGADPARVRVTGNCKADQAVTPMDEARKSDLRSQFGLPAQAKVIVAGSTNPGEDAPVLDAFLAARDQHKGLRLIVAPRQIERSDEIVELAAQRALSSGRRSAPETITGQEDVIVLDTFGELADTFALADVSFVGGSLIPRGCHSILQPIAQGKAVFFGPHTFKAKDLVAQATAAGVGFEVQDGAQLGREMSSLLSDPARLDDIKARCERMMQANQGASRRTADALLELYEQATGEKS